MLFEISLEKQPSLISELQLQLAKAYQEVQAEHMYNNEEKQLFSYAYLNNKPLKSDPLKNEPLTNEQIMKLKQNYAEVREKISFDSFFL